jgi:23S rRNA pseudouridine1911/1915/1917 synthase
MSKPSSLQQFRVSRAKNGTKLSSFLAQQLEISGSKAKSLLNSKAVWVNGKRVWMAKHPLSAGDEVEVRAQLPRTTTAAPVEILYEDEALLAVQKPPGLISESHADSVESLLRTQRAQPSLRALHRLDRETSGVFLLLKDPSKRTRFIDCFKDPAMEKRYAVLLAGSLPSPRCEVDRRIDGKTAHSRFYRKTERNGFCRAECRITTGRTHQIRKHVGHLGCRVIGESRYTHGPEITALEKAVPRQMLHAEYIAFPCPLTGAEIRITAPWPADFTSAANSFGLLS